MAGQPRQIAVRLSPAKPLAKAYALGLLSSTGPRLFRVLLLLSRGKLGVSPAWLQVRTIVLQANALHRFPAFCGVLVGGSTLLQAPLRLVIVLLLRAIHAQQINVAAIARAARFLAAVLSAAVSFSLLNKKPTTSVSSTSKSLRPFSTHLDVLAPGPFDSPPEQTSPEVDDATLAAKGLSRGDLAGKTMDLTLFAAVRALDVILTGLWERAPPTKRSSKLQAIARSIPTPLFCFSAATIMHSWFYSPSRLPQTYNRWISAAAELDQRLLLALRHARYGTWIYGKDTGKAPLLGSMCRDYGLPEVWGDPAKTCPIPCELVHMGRGQSCEKHALVRFWRGWYFAAKMYAPLQLLVLAKNARNRRRITWPAVLRAMIDTTRSSAFLGAFISCFYYGVCLARTRLGPRLFSTKTVTPQMWDSGLCVLAGCMLCGSSILVEQQRKRLEIMFFVLPRAAATWFPRRYLPEHRWKEHVAFTLCAAIILTTAQESPQRLRGVLGSILHGVLNTS